MGIVQPTGYIQQTSPPSYLGFTTGSAIYLDANKITSYPGSGSIWYDLSGNANNASISGSISFTNGGTGSVSYFSYPGGTGSIATSISCANVIGNSAQTGSITIGGWCKTTINNSMTGSGGYGYVPLYSYGVAAQGNYNQGLTSNLEYTNVNDSKIMGRLYSSGGVAFPVTTDGYFYNYNSKWMHLMIQWTYVATGSTADNIRIYVNGTNQNTLRGDNGDTGPIAGDRKARVGYNSQLGSVSTLFYNGSFATLEVYDKFITSQQVYGNFYVSKSLYGY